MQKLDGRRFSVYRNFSWLHFVERRRNRRNLDLHIAFNADFRVEIYRCKKDLHAHDKTEIKYKVKAFEMFYLQLFLFLHFSEKKIEKKSLKKKTITFQIVIRIIFKLSCIFIFIATE